MLLSLVGELRVGTSLNLHIGEGEMFLNILACVVRVTSHYSKNWRAGCTFIRVSEAPLAHGDFVFLGQQLLRVDLQ